jgi:four helix bundle protein
VKRSSSDHGIVNSYRDLKVWQEAMSLAVACYHLTRGFPRDELFGLTAQIRRAAASIPANIAEGHGRESTGSFVQFLRVAQGSLKELETHLLLAGEVGLSTQPPDALLRRSGEIGRMLRALIRSLQKAAG